MLVAWFIQKIGVPATIHAHAVNIAVNILVDYLARHCCVLSELQLLQFQTIISPNRNEIFRKLFSV